jgi:hypothetical protein
VTVQRRVLFPTLLLAAVGCGGAAEQAAQKETSHLRLLTNLYVKAARDTGRNPANEQEFKDAIGKMDLSLEAMKLATIDEVFVSERDGKPFVIVYGSSPQGVVAYEQEGVDGKRQVGFKLGNIEEADEARFRELVPQGGTKAK